MHALDIIGDPVRRRILELLADGERSAGEIGEVVQREFGISQPAVSQHLRVLREAGFASARAEGTRRLYAIDPAPLEAADAWFDPFRRFWQPKLDALGTELARGRRARRLAGDGDQRSDASAAASDQPGAGPAHTTDPAAAPAIDAGATETPAPGDDKEN
ncbi:ArsR/SmtB family transcription factor [Microbacterium allomyrinae]|uniref:Winged helix-turn-helix transcriptional regulator n=1 Tax=Microbacterium allomyrinae TaxID=2830666 RepID=A0A9X1LSI4_9MICO|nr:metalloregulator ArsR/SmtB family transcription factor [Microbacterium allomyrinae]MCC2031342.1 winged helix-turn-helix transcriptional regulator [Microbacterium allomyrinae]